jgi:glycosyltransferase involved in cell wall biosynthesis
VSRYVAVNGWFWGQLATGSGQYLHALAQHLPQIEGSASYTLVLPKARFPDGPLASFAIPDTWQSLRVGTPFDRVNQNMAKVWFEQVAFPRACRLAKADLAFVPYWGSPGWQPCRTAVTVHDLIPLMLPAYRGGVSQRLYTRLVSWTAQRAGVVLTDSQSSRQDIIRYLHIPKERIHAVLLAADEQYRPITDPAELQRVQQKYHLPSRFILYLGGFDVRKNVPRLLRAYARFLREGDRASDLGGLGRPLRSDSAPFLIIAGKLPAADTEFAPDPRRVVAEEGIVDQVQFTGWVDEADKPALYSLASAFVFPSLYEGFGLPVAEAAACGTPVLTSNRSSLPEVDPAALLVDPEDDDALAQGIAQILTAQRTPGNGRGWQQVAQETWRAWQPSQ